MLIQDMRQKEMDWFGRLRQRLHSVFSEQIIKHALFSHSETT